MRNSDLLYYHRFIVVLLYIGLALNARAQQDSIRISPTAARLLQCTYLGVPLVAGGLIEKGQDKKFRSLRNGHIPAFRNSADNYLQFAPLAAQYILKATGVKSRSSWKEMVTNDAISAALMAGVVNTIKYSAREMRPDGSTKNSFPSGHTATVFMTATMLNKEYGHISPWIGIGAYATATATASMRVMNNRHWISDVMAGAGIGIMSTEFGYWIGDLIFKHKETHEEIHDLWQNYKPSNPSFIGFYGGFQLPLSHYDTDDSNEFYTSTGSTVGLEGAWFWNHHWGVGGRASMSSVYYSKEDVDDENGDTYQFRIAQAGIYMHRSIYKFFYWGAKGLVGIQYYPSIHNTYLDISSRTGFSGSTGVSLGVLANRNIDVNLGIEYNIMPPHSYGSREHMSTIGFNARLAYRIYRETQKR